MRNPFAKTRKITKPYATFKRAAWEWRVLKTYQLPQNENKNRYARWLVAAKSPHTFGSWEMGDTYIREMLGIPGIRMIQADEEFKDALYFGGQFFLARRCPSYFARRSCDDAQRARQSIR